MTSSQHLIQKEWAKGKCPVVNGIIFGDGRIAELSHPTIGLSSLQVLNWSDVASFAKNCDRICWTHLISLVRLPQPMHDILIMGGEGAYGEEGFVAVVNLSDEHLIWVAHFDYSNPFIEISLDNDTVIGLTTYNDEWAFPLHNPEQAIVDKF